MAIPDEVSNLIKNSGNNFHAKVARWFSANNWHVVVSPYYMDQTQNKPREIDLMAEMLWPVNDMHGRHLDYIAVRLFIECKYVLSPSVFWFAEKDQVSAKRLVCGKGSFRKNNIHTDRHHYLTQSLKVAKLFATSTSKTAENEPFYKALTQTLNAMVSMTIRPFSIPRLKELRNPPCENIQFPVVVCNSFDKIYSVDFNTESQPELIKDNFQLEVRYAYLDINNTQRDDYFLLDFVEFNQLEKFTEAITRDADIAASFHGGELNS
jgi:hypothetical protein